MTTPIDAHLLRTLFPNASKSTLQVNSEIIAPPAVASDASTGIVERSTKSWKFTIPGDVMGKPRMVRGDKWKKRECVMRFRAWADAARAAAPKDLPTCPLTVNWTAYIRIPKSYSARRAKNMHGQPHTHKPDRDNIDKGLLDALFKRDECVAFGTLRKFWTLEFARMEVEVSQ